MFITYNDTLGLESRVEDIFNILNQLRSKIVVFDEAHNLFRSILTQSKRGI